MEQAKREVNSEFEVVAIDADSIKDKSDEHAEDLDEEVIPPVKEGEEPKEGEEKEKSKEESKEESKDEPEEKTEEESKEQPKEEETPESSPEEEKVPPKPVEGETPREKALRLEVTRLKKERRDKDRDKLLEGTEEETPKTDEEFEKLKEQYTPEEMANMEKLFDIFGAKKGFVRKDESYAGTANAVLDTFLEDHDEYSPAKDQDDLKWGAFQRILTSDYNLRSKTPKQMKSIFEKVDRDVKEELGESASEPQSKEKIAAQRQKVQSVSHSGGTKSSIESKKGNVDTSKPIGGIAFKGFNDEEDFTE